MIKRRPFLQGAGTAGGMIVGCGYLGAVTVPQCVPMPASSLFTENEDKYWAAIRRQFIIPRDVISLNNGTMGSCPLYPQAFQNS